MFDKILIANRGEIAVRIAATAHRLGISCVAVYSDADRDAMHVQVCDEAYRVGPAPAGESYLNAERILKAAVASGADAIHPGYGFLSENAAFAESCESQGIAFVGPPAKAIIAMGSKSRAKDLLERAGIATVPGYHGDEQKDEWLFEESKLIGYPQLIKASAGGGGKGMKRVDSETEFQAALESARRESRSSFGDDKVLIERYLERPRHVEMQIFADRHGNCVHLFERDCSVQRRHQKILEEAPAPGIDDELRARMGRAAVDCARAIDYVGAGTVEFLLDADGEFYFMEMNTRLQVEHPVTEMITGLDLVEWQFRVAAGESLPSTQDEIHSNGHAFEARIYAESPERDFMPAAGQIRYLALPEAEEGLRVDTGVRGGDHIGIHYDPMIAKLIAHGADRAKAARKLARALQSFHVLGLKTNLGFLSRLVATPEFGAAEVDTGFIDRHRQALFPPQDEQAPLAAVLAASAILPGIDVEGADAGTPWDSRVHWRMNLRAEQTITLFLEGREYCLEIVYENGSWRFEIDGRGYRVAGKRLDERHLRVRVNGRYYLYPVLREDDRISLCLQGQVYEFDIPGTGPVADTAVVDAAHPRAPMSGAVVALPISVGDTVDPGTTLMVIEAMKMEHAIVAQTGARVGEILFAVGDQVEEGDTLVLLEVD
ncbi:MAG TPA: acetyl-CoA carboxylase biotin carboxylase subunit [Gammaproteobacteria bacterium]|nr:acetyl-CoA carboxylase biotin carboxylase subunit [Gammaproteobacteria bacterium]